MYLFTNDYSEGCHPAILAALTQSNRSQQPGYGADTFTAQAIALLQAKLAEMTGLLRQAGQQKKQQAAVALGRQLAVDLWRIRTGRASAQDLGLELGV